MELSKALHLQKILFERSIIEEKRVDVLNDVKRYQMFLAEAHKVLAEVEAKLKINNQMIKAI